MQRIWVSGYRAFELAVFDPKDPKKTVIERVLKEFLTQWLNQNEEESWLITGPQLGVEQWSAEAGLSLKEDYPRLKVAMMLPFADFANRWNEANQAQLASLKANVDFSAEVSPNPTSHPSSYGCTSASCLSTPTGSSWFTIPTRKTTRTKRASPTGYTARPSATKRTFPTTKST